MSVHIFLNFFQQYFNSSTVVLSVQISLVKCIPKSSVIFDAIVNKIVF